MSTHEQFSEDESSVFQPNNAVGGRVGDGIDPVINGPDDMARFDDGSMANGSSRPPKTVPVSFRPSDTIQTGRPCGVCGEPTAVLGLYQVGGGRLKLVKGNGPIELDPREVFEPTGELHARLRGD